MPDIGEFTACQWCGELVLEADLERHWDKEKCPEKGIQEIYDILNEPSKTVSDENLTYFIEDYKPKYNTWWGKLLFKIFKRPAQKFVWIWLSKAATDREIKKFQKRVNKYVNKGYTIQFAMFEDPGK